MRVVQIPKRELRRAHHQRKPAQSVALHAHLHHLLRLVVDRIQYNGANSLVVFRLAQRRVSTHVIAPKSHPCGVQVRPRRKEIHRPAHFIRFVIAERADSPICPVPRKIENEHVVLMVLQRRFQRQQLATAGLVPVAKDNRRCSSQPRKEPSFPLFGSARHNKLQHFRPPGETCHVDFRAAALRLYDAINEEPRNGRGCQHGKKHQGQ